jgi:hypothetical protein
MPNQPATPKLNFRYPVDKTAELQRIADDMGTSLSDVLRMACDRLIRDYPGHVSTDATRPRR